MTTQTPSGKKALKRKAAILITMGLFMQLLAIPAAQAGLIQEIGGAIEEGVGEAADFLGIGGGGGGDATSFTEFGGGLTAPSTEGYAAGLVQATDTREFILNVTNFVLGFLGLIAVIIIIYGGFLYLTAAGAEEQATKGKKSITYAIIGLVIILGSFAIVNTVLQAPSGIEGGRGAAEEGGEVTGGSVQRRFNVLASRVQTMARNIVNAFAFHFDARKDMEDVKELIDSAFDYIKNCSQSGCGDNWSDGLKQNLDVFRDRTNNAITKLQAIKTYIPDTIVESIAIEASIDDLIAEINKYWNNGLDAAANTAEDNGCDDSSLGSCDGDDRGGPENRAVFSSFLAVSRTALDAAYDKANNTVLQSFNARINLSKNQLKEMYDLVGPITDVADEAFDKLVTLQFLKQDLVLITTNSLDSATGSLEDLESAVNGAAAGVPETTSPPFQALTKALRDFTTLYTILSDIFFVDARITANTASGNAPLVVNFSSVGSVDPSGLTIDDKQIEWDLDGDGNYNEGVLGTDDFFECAETSSATTSCTYRKPGTYRARLKITASPEQNPVSTKPYNKEIGAGIAELVIKVNPPVTKINLSYDYGAGQKQVIQYDNKGFLLVDKRSIVVPFSQASTTGVTFNATLTKTTGGEDISAQAGQGATIMWDFGNNVQFENNKANLAASPSNLEAKPVFTQPGRFNVIIEIKNKDGITDRKVFSIIVTSVVPDIQIQPVSAKVGQPITFDGTNSFSDSGQITDYSWEFTPASLGTGVDLTQPEFTKTFDAPGSNYKVKLTVTDSLDNKESLEETFQVMSDPPVAQFKYDFPKANDPALVQLDGSLSYDPDGKAQLQYLWEVNGQPLNQAGASGQIELVDTSDETKPLIRFRQKGEHAITLTVTDPNGLGSGSLQESDPSEKTINVTKTIYVTFDAKDAPTATLTLNPQTGEPEAKVTLNIKTSADAVAYEANFGDGETEEGPISGSQQITHIYKEVGTYPLQVSVFDEEDEEANISRKIFINSSDQPSAVISVTVNDEEVIDTTVPIVVTREDSVMFDGGLSRNTDGTGRRLTYSWDFGDGTRSTQEKVSRKFNEVTVQGKPLTVKLNVTNQENVSQISTPDTVQIEVVGKPPILRGITAIPTGTSLTAPVTVQVNAIGAEDPDGQITRYRWWYYDPNNDTDQLGLQVTSSPAATLTIGTRGLEGEEKTYKFAVEITDDENNTISSRDLIDEARTATLTVTNGPNKAPTATFNVDRTSILVGETVNFSSSATDPDGQVVAYFWDFEGDGFANNTDNLGANVSHTFTEAAPDGIRVRLKVKDNNESEATSDAITIYVDAIAADPVAAFTSAQDGETKNVQFTDKSNADEAAGATLESWKWDFDVSIDSNGDGQKDNDTDSTQQNPVYEYPDFGIYRARLLVEDSEGSTAQVTNFVNVKAPAAPTAPAAQPLDARLLSNPAPSLSDGRIHLTGESGNVTFDYSTSVGEIVKYSMDKNIYFDTNGNGIKDDDADHVATTPGKWTTDFQKAFGTIRVRLTVTDKNGKTDNVEKDVVFDTPPAAPSGSQGGSGSLQANVLGLPGLEIPALLVTTAGFGILLLSRKRR